MFAVTKADGFKTAMHILLIGLGNMGRKYLLKLEELGKLPVLCDKDPNKALDNYPFYCHLEDVEEDIKAVIIAVDPKDHVKLAKVFLDQGIPVLLEKPPALTRLDFMEIYHYPNLYISEVESFSTCLSYFPKNVKTLSIERFGRGRGYVSPLWDLAWHDLYLLQRFFKEIKIEDLRLGDVWELRGKADDVDLTIKTAWEHPNQSRRWIIDDGAFVLDFAKEEVWKDGSLIHRGKTDKLGAMVKAFLSGELDGKSRERALRNIELLEYIDHALAFENKKEV
ncbi:Gfo/Idh/MocA family oxidoreductase [Thermocrinis jamiesonii]|uniref:Gfo/Idh/MocA family oxidoreductase n=1 Tax=Thermocrinis jamiesonii TaxID=1302351 RepID=UPI000A4A149D|nr:Gfo/Idh/MocA family oxidoreductase [Thermocrinis jamiesonii]